MLVPLGQPPEPVFFADGLLEQVRGDGHDGVVLRGVNEEI